MQDLLTLLQEFTHGTAEKNPIARQNLEAAGAQADDIASAVDNSDDDAECPYIGGLI